MNAITWITKATARTLLVVSWLFAALIFQRSALAAEDFPPKLVRIIVPLAAGGPADTSARLIAPALSARWKVPVIVENKPGASGVLAASALLNSPADGGTLLLAITTHIQTLGFKIKLPYDPLGDFTPVTQLLLTSLVLMVPEDGPKSLDEFIATARNNPSGTSYASFGPTSTGHIYGELLNRQAKLKVVNVAYGGGAPAIAALLGGHASASFVEASQAMAFVKSGKLRPLALAGPRRYPDLPDVKTFAELGFAGFELPGWQGVLVRKGTRKDVVNRIAADIRDVTRSPSIRARFSELGAELVGSTPDEWSAVLKHDAAKWTELIESTGITSQ
jgi:tripartite-type tricarboxylate transporter receptor subunit TctC